MMSLLPVLLFALLALLLFAFFPVLAVRANHDHSRIENRFPPIHDDEFVRRCGPGTKRDIALRVRRIVSDYTGIEYSQIYPEHRFGEDLNL